MFLTLTTGEDAKSIDKNSTNSEMQNCGISIFICWSTFLHAFDVQATSQQFTLRTDGRR
jgi:hypothetical protein